jgi:hypothetical protein
MRARTRLGQHLRGHDPEGDPGIDDFVGQAVGGDSAALDDGVEADPLGVANALGKVGEDLAVVEIVVGFVQRNGALRTAVSCGA